MLEVLVFEWCIFDKINMLIIGKNIGINFWYWFILIYKIYKWLNVNDLMYSYC